MATENLIMAAVAAGADRQEAHEVIRVHSHAVTAAIKAGVGQAKDLYTRLQQEATFRGVNFAAETNPRLFVGRAPEQVDEFITAVVEPIRQRYATVLGQQVELKV
jgi:adenylosuccinate lyase